MPRKSEAAKFSSVVDNIEEQYIRSGGKDPYVLTLLTRAYSDGKKKGDDTRQKDLVRNYETMKQNLIRQYNDVELENVKLQYELLSIQQQLKSQLPQKGASGRRSGTTPNATQSAVKKQSAPSSPQKVQKSPQAGVVQPGIEHHLSLVQTNLPFLTNLSRPSLSATNKQAFSFTPGLPFTLQGFQPNFRNPFGNTYIVTGDEVYINGLDVDVGDESPHSSKAPFTSFPKSFKNTNRQRRKLSVPNAAPVQSSPVLGFDADWQSESGDIQYNNENFFEINRLVPQGQYDFNSGALIFFDFVTKLPKEARFCRLSVALITAGRMKPPISFTALPTEQCSPGYHSEFAHFTTVCRLGFCLAVSGGRPHGSSTKSGISLIAELMISPDKPLDDQAPVLGWIRHGWVPISATKKMFDDESNLAVYAGRFRTMLRKTLPLTRDADGLLGFMRDSEQERVDHQTELFYRIVNATQADLERLAPVDVKNIEFYDEF